jgi:hypothetical protein
VVVATRRSFSCRTFGNTDVKSLRWRRRAASSGGGVGDCDMTKKQCDRGMGERGREQGGGTYSEGERSMNKEQREKARRRQFRTMHEDPGRRSMTEDSHCFSREEIMRRSFFHLRKTPLSTILNSLPTTQATNIIVPTNPPTYSNILLHINRDFILKRKAVSIPRSSWQFPISTDLYRPRRSLRHWLRQLPNRTDIIGDLQGGAIDSLGSSRTIENKD